MTRAVMSNPPTIGILESLQLDLAKALEHVENIRRKIADVERIAAEAARLNLILTPAASYKPQGELETLGDLIQIYLTVEGSPYRKLSHASKQHYATLLALVREDRGSERLAELKKEDFENWHSKWSEGGKKSSGHAKIGMVRNVLGYGNADLRDENCARLYGVLAKLKFKPPVSRTIQLSQTQADQIRLMAHSVKRPSIALAQAFQIGVGMLQKDVIGEWVPVGEKAVSDIMHDGFKWVRGVRWNEIDENFTLRHASDWQGDVECDLRKCRVVMDELNKQYGVSIERPVRSLLPLSGAIIVADKDKLPWDAVEFRRQWRKLADACGIPDTVRNGDSRTKRGWPN